MPRILAKAAREVQAMIECAKCKAEPEGPIVLTAEGLVCWLCFIATLTFDAIEQAPAEQVTVH